MNAEQEKLIQDIVRAANEVPDIKGANEERHKIALENVLTSLGDIKHEVLSIEEDIAECLENLKVAKDFFNVMYLHTSIPSGPSASALIEAHNSLNSSLLNYINAQTDSYYDLIGQQPEAAGRVGEEHEDQ